jgi:hypothetical protein
VIRFGVVPFLECSSKGDVRFSAFYARLNLFDGRSIEEVYQASKIFADGSTGLTWREAKGKRCVNVDETRALYSRLWDLYIEENIALLDTLRQASGLSDVFGQQDHACQAEELWRIRNS